jgi:hypothetical protein
MNRLPETTLQGYCNTKSILKNDFMAEAEL